MDLEARNANLANWQLPTQPLSFKEPFRAAHWVRAAKTHNHPSSPLLNTASSHPLAGAPVTVARDSRKSPPQSKGSLGERPAPLSPHPRSTRRRPHHLA